MTRWVPSTLSEIQEVTGAGLGGRCRDLNPSGQCCHPDIMELLRLHAGGPSNTGGCCCGWHGG